MKKNDDLASNLTALKKLLEDFSNQGQPEAIGIMLHNAKALLQELGRRPDTQTIERLNRLLVKLQGQGLNCPKILVPPASKIVLKSSVSGQFSEGKKARAVDVLSMMSGPRDQCKYCGEKRENCTCRKK